jgi:SPP1 gp7 family putative phage head morphogenesis protein
LLFKRVAFDTEAQMRVIDTLTRSTALGYNPRKTARLIQDDLAMGLNNAMQIARTEQLRVYRETSRMQYEESDVVKGYKRIAALSDRTCPACLMADGTVYRTTTEFWEHVQGRCSLIPIVIGAPDPEWETGMDWFKRQNPDTQQKILGPGRYNAWKDKQFQLEDLITKKRNKTWGNALVPTSLKKLVN